MLLSSRGADFPFSSSSTLQCQHLDRSTLSSSNPRRRSSSRDSEHLRRDPHLHRQARPCSSDSGEFSLQYYSFRLEPNSFLFLQSAPIMIALETSADPTIVSRAFAIHSILHHKHGSIINTRFSETARVCFDYQSKIDTNAVRGESSRRPSASFLSFDLTRLSSLFPQRLPSNDRQHLRRASPCGSSASLVQSHPREETPSTGLPQDPRSILRCRCGRFLVSNFDFSSESFFLLPSSELFN